MFKISDGTLWHDSSIEKIIIEYNDISVVLETDAGVKKIVFRNYIALEYIGQWDENIVSSIYEDTDTDFVQNALMKVEMNNNVKRKGGGTRDIDSEWKCYIIKLIDDVFIKIVCNEIAYE